MTAPVKACLAAILSAAFALMPAYAAAKDDPPLTYTVKSGDTLHSLADRYFISSRVIGEVAKLNNIGNSNRISVGQVLAIPRNFLKYETLDLEVRSFSGATLVEGRPAAKGARLREGQSVSTGVNGFVTFQGTRGAAVALPSNTSATLVQSRIYVLGNTLDVDFKIVNGRGEVIAPKLRQQERFRMRTPSAVTAVRGTVFRVGHNADSGVSVAEVTEGAVAVEAGSQNALAKSGFGIPMTAAGVGPIETLLPVPEIVDPAAIQMGESLAFTIVPVAGATAYRTQIAADAGFLEIVGQDVGDDTNAAFAGLPNGTYFVRSRGVSASGVEGLSESVPFKRKRIGVTASAESSPLEDGLKFSWLADGGGDSSFAFQLWNEANPSQPIVDEVGVQDDGFIITGLEPGRYVWRVAASKVDEDGLLKVWSPEQTLNVSE